MANGFCRTCIFGDFKPWWWNKSEAPKFLLQVSTLNVWRWWHVNVSLLWDGNQVWEAKQPFVSLWRLHQSSGWESLPPSNLILQFLSFLDYSHFSIRTSGLTWAKAKMSLHFAIHNLTTEQDTLISWIQISFWHVGLILVWAELWVCD